MATLPRRAIYNASRSSLLTCDVFFFLYAYIHRFLPWAFNYKILYFLSIFPLSFAVDNTVGFFSADILSLDRAYRWKKLKVLREEYAV